MPGPDPNAPDVDNSSRVWITLITQSSYLPGVTLLVHTLYHQKSKHSLIVQYTSKLEKKCIDCLRDLLAFYPLLRIQQVEPIPLPENSTSLAKRFDDTLTKLRAFQPLSAQAPTEPPLDRPPEEICFLDADMIIRRNNDDIFTIPRPSTDWIAAHHQCVCNVDNDPWAPPEWNIDNCPCTPLSHPAALLAPIPSSSVDGARSTYQLLNSGVFVCTPSADLWTRMENFRLTDPRVKDFSFPDQNFLDTFFHDRWVPIGWQYNAFKTHRYWHAAMWRDEEVRAVHFIVDKPWEKRVVWDGGEPVAGYKGRDGVTHLWWWKEFDKWVEGMRGRGDGAKAVAEFVLGYVEVDSKLGEARSKE